MTDREIMQQALGAIRALMNGRNFGTGQTGHYLNIISRIDDELSRPQPEQEFYPDWDMLKPYHERIAELEAALAQPEQEPVAWELRKGKTDRVLLEITNNPARAHSWKCSLEEVVPLYAAPFEQEEGCAECGVKAIDGYALYCVACTEKFVGGYKENVPVHTSELLTQVSTGNHYSGNGTAGVQNKTKPTGLFFLMPPKQWVGLTDEEITDLWENNDTDWESIKRVEATLKEKNMSEQAPFDRLLRIMGTFDLATGHADNLNDLLDSLESELRDVLGHYRNALKAPIKREWVGLANLDMPTIRDGDHAFWAGAQFADAWLKEKNT